MKFYKKQSARLSAKFIQLSTNKIILTLPTDSMEAYQFFSNDFIDQIMKNTFKNYESIGPVKVMIDQDFQLV